MVRIRHHKGQSKAQRDARVRRSAEQAAQWPAHPQGDRGVWVLGQDGEWREGHGGAERLPDRLASLPSEIVTKDSSDGDRAHALDPPHVVEAIADDYTRAEEQDRSPQRLEADALMAQMAAPIGEVVPCTQLRVDMVRWRVAYKVVLPMWLRGFEAGDDVDLGEPWHVWFPNNNVNEYELRRGPAPRSDERPRHLRHLRLRVNPMDPPRSVRDLLKLHDVPVPDPTRVIEQAKTQMVNDFIDLEDEA